MGEIEGQKLSQNNLFQKKPPRPKRQVAQEKQAILPEFNNKFWEQSLTEQIQQVERGLDAVGLGMDADGFPEPGVLGKQFLTEAAKNPGINVQTGEIITPKNTEECHAVSIAYDKDGWASRVEFTEERRALHQKIAGKALAGNQAWISQDGYESLGQWAQAKGMTLEEAKAKGIRHRGGRISIPAVDKNGNPIYEDGVGSLLGSSHPITLKLAAEGPGSLDQAEKDFIKYHAAQARNGGPKQTLLLMGGPAAGKTSGLDQRSDLKPKHSVVLNPDDVKDELPEFQRMVEAGEPGAASLVHNESSRIANQIKAFATELELNTVADGTGNHNVESFETELERLHKSGVEVSLLAVDVPTDVAVVRAVSRAKDSGRWVPEPVIRKTHKSVAENLKTFIGDPRLNQVSVFDNSGETAVEIATSFRGQVTVKREELLNRVFSKSDAPPIRTVTEPTLPGSGKLKEKEGGNISPDKWTHYPASNWTRYLGKKLPMYFREGSFYEDGTNLKLKNAPVSPSINKKIQIKRNSKVKK